MTMWYGGRPRSPEGIATLRARAGAKARAWSVVAAMHRDEYRQHLVAARAAGQLRGAAEWTAKRAVARAHPQDYEAALARELRR